MEIKPHLCDEYSTVSPAYEASKRWHKSEYTTERCCRDILLLWWLSSVGGTKFFNPGANWDFMQLEYFYGLHNFFAFTIKSRVDVHNTFATKRFSIAKQSRRTNSFFYHFLATISIQIHPDTAKMCFTKLKWIFVPHLIKLIRLERRGKGRKTKKRTIKMFKAF